MCKRFQSLSSHAMQLTVAPHMTCEGEKVFQSQFYKISLSFFFDQKSHLVKNSPRNWSVSIRLIFYLQFQFCAVSRLMLMDLLWCRLWTRHFTRSTQQSKSLKLTFPESLSILNLSIGHLPHSRRAAPFDFFYHCFPVFRKILFCFARERSSSAGTSPRRVNGPHVKAHGKHVADTPGGFPHIDRGGEGVVGAGG